MLMLTNSIKRLINDKKQSIYSLCVVALAVIIPLLTMSVALTFAGSSYVELVNISFFLQFYVTNPKNSINQMCMALSVVLVIIGCVMVVVYFANKIFANKKEYKSYLLMGATYGQLAFMIWIENILLLVSGIVAGGILSYIFGLLLGAIWSVKIIFSFKILSIISLIYIAMVTIVSLIRPLWASTSAR